MSRIKPQKHNTQTNKLTILRAVMKLEIYFLSLLRSVLKRSVFPDLQEIDTIKIQAIIIGKVIRLFNEGRKTNTNEI